MSPHDIRLETNGQKGAFVIDKDGIRLATLTYTVAGENTMIIDHTEVSEELRGTGAGKALVAAAVELARREHKGIIPLCPFAKSVFDRTPAFSDIRR